jgi:DNA-binding GntR family transcriptional regulator
MPVPNAPPLEKRLFREDVYSTIKNWIIDGTLEPLEKIRDAELALQLGVSRTPIREALRRLEDEKLIETKSNAWTRVTGVDASLAMRVYPILRLLEPLALELGFSALEESDFIRMKTLNKAVQQNLKSANAKAAALEDTALHNLWTGRCQNPELLSILADLKTNHIRLEIHYWRGDQAASKSISEHQKIIAALENKDLITAKHELEAHWTRALARWEAK